MMLFTNKFFLFFFMLVPFFLITGPAIPDIIITFSLIFFLIYFLLVKGDFYFIKDRFFIISIFFWLSIIFVSLYAYDKLKSFQDSIIFLRFLIMPTIGYFLFFSSEDKLKKITTIIFYCICFVLIDSLFQYLNYESETGFGKDLLGFKSDWYGRLTGPFGDELVPGAYMSKFGLLGYLYFYFIKNKKYNNYFEILYLGLLGFACFASGERMAFATYFMGLFL